jgi:MFS family permease
LNASAVSAISAFQAAERDARYEGWRVAIASGVGVFVSFASILVYTFGVFLKPLSEQFGWSRAAVSAAFGIAAMTVAVCSPPLGYLLDRVNPRRIVVPAIAVFGTALASLSLLTAPIWHLYAVFLVMGIVGNGTAQMAYSRAVSSWFDARRGMALAMVMSGGAIGAMVWPPAAEALIQYAGWRAACAILGGLVVAIGLPAAGLFLRERPSTRYGSRVPAQAAIADALRSRAFWIVVIVLFLTSIAQNGALTHMAALLTDRGVSPTRAATALAAMGGASLAGRFVTGWLLDRFFAPRVALVLLTAAAVGTLVLSGAHSFAIGTVAAVLIGLGMGGEADVTPYVLLRYFGLKSFATLYGLTWTAYAIAGAIGPVLMGEVFDATASYTTLLVILAVVTASAASLMQLLPRYPTLNAETAKTSEAP